MEITNKLTNLGWQRYNAGPTDYEKEYWAKRYPEAPRCNQNQEKEGIQLILKVYEIGDRQGFTLQIRAEKPDEVWVDLQTYGIGEELFDVLDKQIEQLLAAWKTMHTMAQNQVKQKP